ncbi:MAG: hypothetical protein WC998_04490 [Candidatus Paceibacterota bacterium]|jgi:hypothetical protein
MGEICRVIRGVQSGEKGGGVNPIKDLRGKKGEPRPHHPNLGPSSIPAILQCACFVGRGESDDDANKGNEIHNHCQNLTAGIDAPTTLDRGERDACGWAAGEVKAIFGTYAPGEEIRIEEKHEVKDGSGRSVSWGYSDWNGGAVVIDAKSGLDWRPDLHWYKPQLGTYALAIMQRSAVERVLCVELYVLPNRKREYWITKIECEAYIAAAITRRRNPEKKPVCCDYCKWCGRLIWCTAVNALAWRTVELFAQASGKAELFASPEQISCPETMAQALTVWKKIMVPLGARIESAALALAQKLKPDGKELPYYVLDNSRSRDKIVDVREAFNRLPFDNPTFCRALETTPKRVADVYSEVFGVPERQARRTVDELCGDLIVSGESNPTLKPILQNQTKKRGRGK